MPIKYIVVDIKLLFILGMSFLKLAGIIVDYTTRKVIMQLPNGIIINLKGQLNVPE